MLSYFGPIQTQVIKNSDSLRSLVPESLLFRTGYICYALSNTCAFFGYEKIHMPLIHSK